MKFEQIPQEQIRIPGENYFHSITPYFRYENIMNEVQSQIQGRPVYEMKEVVELRFAANPNYKPVFGVDEMYRRVDNRVITYAERFADQYQAFLAGAPQEAEGTPLEELTPFGITPAQLSICRALSIYSIEALHHLEGPAIKKLGYHANALKPMARKYMEARSDGSASQAEINELRRQIAELRGEAPASNVVQEDEPVLPDGYEGMSEDQLKEAIAALNEGKKPRGNPSRETLVSMLKGLEAA